jgi:hypothetical protein
VIYTVFMPEPDGSLRVAITLAAPGPTAAYERAIELTGIAGAAAKITPAAVTCGCGHTAHARDCEAAIPGPYIMCPCTSYRARPTYLGAKHR